MSNAALLHMQKIKLEKPVAVASNVMMKIIVEEVDDRNYKAASIKKFCRDGFVVIEIVDLIWQIRKVPHPLRSITPVQKDLIENPIRGHD